MNGKYFYIKDEDCVWNPGWKPTQTDLDSYECRHGIGYSRFTGSKNGLRADLLAFVPMDDPCEISQLKLTNNSSASGNSDSQVVVSTPNPRGDNFRCNPCHTRSARPLSVSTSTFTS